MDCRDCARFDSIEARCRDGKVNPQRYEHALSVAQVMGLRAICMFNDHRERVVGVRQGRTKDEARGTKEELGRAD